MRGLSYELKMQSPISLKNAIKHQKMAKKEPKVVKKVKKTLKVKIRVRLRSSHKESTNL